VRPRPSEARKGGKEKIRALGEEAGLTKKSLAGEEKEGEGPPLW